MGIKRPSGIAKSLDIKPVLLYGIELKPGFIMAEQIGLYGSRPGAIELEYQSQNQLSPEQKREVLAFEHQLYRSEAMGREYLAASEILEQTEIPPLEEVWQMPDDKAGFYPRYFLSAEGQEKLRGVFREIPEAIFASEAKLAQHLAGVDWSKVKVEEFEKLAGSSLRYARTYVAKQFAERNFATVDGIDLPDSLAIIFDPGELQAKVQSLRQVKAYYRAVWRDLRGQPMTLEVEAKVVIAELYLKKINWLLAGALPDALEFTRQAAISDQTDLQKLSNKINALLPVKQEPNFGGAAERYDRFRNGVVTDPITGVYTIVNPDLLELISKQTEGEVEAGHFSKEDVGRLEGIKIQADEIKSWLEGLLEEHGLLSQDPDVDLRRGGRPADGKWQVILTEKVTTMSVNGRQGFVKVPASFKRNVIRAAVLACHEFAHVVQHENKGQLMELELAQQIGTDRASVMFEAGGLWYEEQAKQVLFGDKRPAKRHYLAAVRTRLDGGSFLEAWKAYFDSASHAEPTEDLTKRAEIAFSSTRRIFRKGGMFTGPGMVADSQPLHYLEQSLVAQSLTGEDKKLLLVGGINIGTLNKLGRVGLLNRAELIKAIWAPAPWEALRPLIERKLREDSL